MDKKTINQQRQNKPSLIVDDLANRYVTENDIYESLLARGVFKWLAVRRDLIRAKDCWRRKITETHEMQTTGYIKGYRKALVECRQEIRRLCHSSRWQAPLFDKRAVHWLNNRERQNA